MMLPCLLAALALVQGQLGDGLAQTPEPTPDTQTMLAAWEQIGLNANPEAAAFIEQRIASQAPGRDYWHEVFSRFDYPFTANHEAFLSYLLGTSGLFETALPMAAAATAEAFGYGPWVFTGVSGPYRAWPDGGKTLLRWTATLVNNVPEGPARNVLREAFGAALEGKPLPLQEWLSIEATAQVGAFIMELLLVLDALAEGEQVLRWVTLPESMTAIYPETQVLIWDVGRLSPSQQRSLEGLYTAFPREAHQIGFLMASEVLGVSAASINKDTPPFALDLEIIPLNALFSEVSVETGIAAAAPRFTVEAAAQLARALAYRANFERPQANARFDRILARAGQTAEAYPLLRVPDSADALLADTMRAWTIDAEGQLERAIAQAESGYYTVLESFFALADVLSAGKDSAPALASSVVGEISAAEARLARSAFAGGALVTGMTIDEVSVSGTLDERGYIVAITTP